MKRSKAQLNAISRAYSKQLKQEWREMFLQYPEEWKIINSNYKYTRVKIKKLNELLKNGHYHIIAGVLIYEWARIN